MSYLNVDFSGLLATLPGLASMTLTKKTAGAYNASDPASGTSPTSASFPGRGYVEKLVREPNSNDLTRYQSATLVLMLGTFGVAPDVGDTIAFVAPDSGASMVGYVQKSNSDPSGAQAEVEVNA